MSAGAKIGEKRRTGTQSLVGIEYDFQTMAAQKQGGISEGDSGPH